MIKIGHRGACGYEPENTIRSFERAIACGVDMIECDVRKCKTGELVIMHDNMVNRTTNGTGFVSKLTLAELQKFDAGKGEKIPTLRETLDVINRKVQVNIEVVQENETQEIAEVLSEYTSQKGWTYSDFLISSYLHEELVKIKKIFPIIRIGALLDGSPLSLAKYGTELGAYSINVWKDYATQELIDDAHKRGLKVILYSVNVPEDIAQKKSWGVDGLFSDFPDRL